MSVILSPYAQSAQKTYANDRLYRNNGNNNTDGISERSFSHGSPLRTICREIATVPTIAQSQSGSAEQRMGNARDVPADGILKSSQKIAWVSEHPLSDKIPVVRHVFTDKDLELPLPIEPSASLTFAKVLDFLTDSISCKLYQRHSAVLNRLVGHYSHGFFLKDLVSVFKLINLCADRLADSTCYLRPLLQLIRLAGLPYLKEKSSDEYLYEMIAVQSASQLGYLLRIDNVDIQKQICSSLLNLYMAGNRRDGSQVSTHAFCRRIVERSDAAFVFLQSLPLAAKQVSIHKEILSVLQHLAATSHSNCEKILAAGGARAICSSMLDDTSSRNGGELLFRSVDVMWCLLEQTAGSELVRQISDHSSISNLKEAFTRQLTSGCSHYDRQLRNDLLALCALIASHSPVDAPFIQTGFTRQLVLLATFEEVKSHHALVKHLKLTTCYEDFEMKKMLIDLMVSLCVDGSSLSIMSEGHLLLALFTMASPPERRIKRPGSSVSMGRNVHGWSPAEQEELQLLSLSALCTLSPLLTEDYMICGGNSRVLSLLEWCLHQDGFKGAGNAFHGAGGRDSKRAQLRHTIRLLRSVVGAGGETLLQDLVDQNAVQQLLDIVQLMTTNESCRDEIGCEMQTDIMFSISAICQSDIHRKELFGHVGTKICVHYLEHCPARISSGLGYKRLLLTAIDAIWCCILGCDLNEDAFMASDGVFRLLDLLHMCPVNLRSVVMGVLLDLCENPRCIPHLVTWRGTKACTMGHLLCELWREEEERIGVPRNADNSVAENGDALMGVEQARTPARILPSAEASAAIVDVNENLRAKIYGVFCKLGFEELRGLTTDDMVTLVIIEKYMDLKVSEVWSEVVREVDAEAGLAALPADGEALDVITRGIDEKVAELVDTQRDILASAVERDRGDEQTFYSEIRERQKQREKAFVYYHDFIERTSKYNKLKEKATAQDASIDASRVGEASVKYREVILFNRGQFHGTDLPGLTATTFTRRMRFVDSTPVEITGRPKPRYDTHAEGQKRPKVEKIGKKGGKKGPPPPRPAAPPKDTTAKEQAAADALGIDDNNADDVCKSPKKKGSTALTTPISILEKLSQADVFRVKQLATVEHKEEIDAVVGAQSKAANSKKHLRGYKYVVFANKERLFEAQEYSKLSCRKYCSKARYLQIRVMYGQQEAMRLIRPRNTCSFCGIGMDRMIVETPPGVVIGFIKQM